MEISKKTKKKRGKGSTRADLETRAQKILDKGVILDIGNNIGFSTNGSLANAVDDNFVHSARII